MGSPSEKVKKNIVDPWFHEFLPMSSSPCQIGIDCRRLGAHHVVFLHPMWCFQVANHWLHRCWVSTRLPLGLFLIGGISFQRLTRLDVMVWPIGCFPRSPRSTTSSLGTWPIMDWYCFHKGSTVWLSWGWPSKALMAVDNHAPAIGGDQVDIIA